MSNNWIHPFDPNIFNLVSISTGVMPGNDIKYDLMNAHNKGEAAYQKFKQERLESHEATFTNKLSRQQLVKIGDKEVMLKADLNLFQNMTVTTQSRHI